MITQKDFESFYTTYLDHLKIQCENVCNTNLMSISTYVKRVLNIDSYKWERTEIFVFDYYKNKLSVYEINGVQFVVFNWKQTTIEKVLGYRIESYNSRYPEPVKFKNDSFYNYNDDLIYCESPERFNYFLEQYCDYQKLNKEWIQFNENKPKLNTKEYQNLPPLIADHFLNCLPPVEFIRGAFLAGEAWKHDENGRALYLEVRGTDKQGFECKFSTVQEFKNTYKIKAA